MGEEGLSLPTTPQRWANRLTKILSVHQAVHGLPRFPIDVAALAQDFSRQVFPDAPITMVGGLDLSKGVEGMLMPRGDGSGEWGIIYNETIRSPGRRNFTLAHELGHYLLHRHAHPGGLKCTNRNMADWDESVTKIEGEANTFASYLLMPLDDFRAQIKGRAIDIDVISPRDEIDDEATLESRVVAMARQLEGRVLTIDPNVVKLASVRSVPAINVNDIALALKSTFVPGDALSVRLVKPGEEPDQGVGYLDDGTMVVVENGRSQIGQTMQVSVTSTLQTSAGRLVFAKPATAA